MTSHKYRIVYYTRDLLLGDIHPIAAIVSEVSPEGSALPVLWFVPVDKLPCEACLGRKEARACLGQGLEDLVRAIQTPSKSEACFLNLPMSMGPHFSLGSIRCIPASVGTSAIQWVMSLLDGSKT